MNCRLVLTFYLSLFNSYESLYLKSKDVLQIKKEGKLEIVEDSTVRKPTYCTSANLAFPHLYPHGEMSPLWRLGLQAEEAGTVCAQNG